MKNKENSYIKSVKLSLYHTFNDDSTTLEIPIKNIIELEIDKISSKIIYLQDGMYDKIDSCGSLELKLSIDNIDQDIINTLL